MKNGQPAATPAQYVAALRGWQAAVVRRLRAAVALNRSLGDPTRAATSSERR